jgi:flagellin-like hook-associated protein FlgL
MPQLPAEPEPPWKATAQALADHPPEVPEPPMLARIVGEHDLGWWCGQMKQVVEWCIANIQTLKSEEKTEMAEIDDLQAQVTASQKAQADTAAAIKVENDKITAIQATLTGLQAQLTGQPALLAAVEKAATDLGAVNAGIESVVQPILNPSTS